MAAFDFHRLQGALMPACRRAFRQLFAKHRGERFYGVGLWTEGGLHWLLPTAMSEEGLDQIVRECRAEGRRAGETDAEIRLQARWSPEDSPRHVEGQEYFGEVNRVMSEIAAVLGEIDIDQGWAEFETFYAQVVDTVCGVFTARDQEGAFGIGEAREAVFVTLMTMDQDETILDIGRRVNPAKSVQRFSAEWAARKAFIQSLPSRRESDLLSPH